MAIRGHLLTVLVQPMQPKKRGSRRDMEMKLLHPELVGKNVIDGHEKPDDRLPIPVRKGLLNLR
jgi:hypothetical protein